MSLADDLKAQIGNESVGVGVNNAGANMLNQYGYGQYAQWQRYQYPSYWTAGALTDDEQLVLIAMRKSIEVRDAILSAALQALINQRIFPPQK